MSSVDGRTCSQSEHDHLIGGEYVPVNIFFGFIRGRAKTQHACMAAINQADHTPDLQSGVESRAGIVKKPQAWRWSSANAHIRGKDDLLVRTPLL